jgi:hypothetical protein
MDRADIAREALEDVKTKLGAVLGRGRIRDQAEEIADAYSVVLRALRRLDRVACPETLRLARAS